MNAYIFGQHRLFRQGILTMLLLAVMGAMIGCRMTPAYLKPSHEVTRAFEAYAFPAEYDYYYHGPTAKPTAIVGVKTGVPFYPGTYKPVEFSNEFIKKWVVGIQDPSNEKYEIFGKSLVLNQKKVGIWYSDWKAPPVRILADGRLSLYAPSTPIPEKGFPEMN